MGNVIRISEQLFWTMIWIVLILVIFVFLSGWLQDHNVPVLGNAFSWAQSHAGLEQ